MIWLNSATKRGVNIFNIVITATSQPMIGDHLRIVIVIASSKAVSVLMVSLRIPITNLGTFG